MTLELFAPPFPEKRQSRLMSAHQPHFLPWLGYLHKVMQADVFVVVDHVQYERQNYQNRNRIKTRSGPQWIVAPVHQLSRGELIVEKRINNQPDGRTTWGQKSFRTLECAYGKSPYFDRYAPGLERLLTARWERLVDLDEALLRWHLEVFDIHTPLVWSSTLDLRGAKSEMIVSMCQAVGCTAYLSGKGASCSYLDLELFAREGLRVIWQEFKHPIYPQCGTPAEFFPRLAAVDLLFNCGPRSAAILRGEPPAVLAAMPVSLPEARTVAAGFAASPEGERAERRAVVE